MHGKKSILGIFNGGVGSGIKGHTTIHPTETPEFKNWFGNSKVVDSDGKPLVVYHGTDAPEDFTSFEKTGTKDAGWYGAGFYFTQTPKHADHYAAPLGYAKSESYGYHPRVVPVYLSVQNPMRVKNTNDLANQIKSLGGNPNLSGKSLTKEIQRLGFDGVFVSEQDEIAVFSPTQIKSAYGNKGTFNPKDPSLTNSLTTQVTPDAVRAAFKNLPPKVPKFTAEEVNPAKNPAILAGKGTGRGKFTARTGFAALSALSGPGIAFEPKNAAAAILNASTAPGEDSQTDVVRDGLLAFAAGLASDLAPLRERIDAIAGLDSPEEMQSAIAQLQNDLPALFKTVAEQDKAADALQETLNASFFNGIYEVAPEDDTAGVDTFGKPTEWGKIAAAIFAAGLLSSSTKELKETGDDIADRAGWATDSVKANLLQDVSDELDGLKDETDPQVLEEKLTSISSRIDHDPNATNSEDITSRPTVVATSSIVPFMAAGFGSIAKAIDAFDDYPCIELYRGEDRKEWRNWPQRWAEAGGEFYDGPSDYPEGRMIAPVGDPIWLAISVFGIPYPPFDYLSGMYIRLVPRDECVQIGAIDPEDMPEAPDIGFNNDVKFNGDLDPDLRAGLVGELGSEFSFDSGDETIGNSRAVKSKEYRQVTEAFRNTVERSKIARLFKSNPTADKYKAAFYKPDPYKEALNNRRKK